MTTVLISPAESGRRLARIFEQSDARCLTWPVLNLDSPIDEAQLREAIENLFGYDWLILKSRTAAEYFLRAFQSRHSVAALDTLRVLALGQETAARAGEFQIHVDIILERFAIAEVYSSINSYVGDNDSARLNLLVPSATLTRESFADQFEESGARVDAIAAYRTTAAPEQLARLKALLAGEAIDYIAINDAGEINELAALFDTDDLGQLFRGVSVICLNEGTAETADNFGLRQTITPSNVGFESLHELIAGYGK